MTTPRSTVAASSAPVVPLALIGLGALAVVYAVFGPGPLSLPGLAILVPVAVGVVLLVIGFAPSALAIAAPLALPLGALSVIFPFEICFVALSSLVVVRGARLRAAWLSRLEPVEVALLALLAWSVFTGWWSTDAAWFWNGVRRNVLGFVALWVGLRLVWTVPRAVFEYGIVLGAASLSVAALAKRFSTGLSSEQAALRRAATTDLGWGTANFIAALLLILSPVVLFFALHAKRRGLRLTAWPTLVLIAVMQGIIASRAAGVMFVIGTLFQVFAYQSRRSLVTLVTVTAGLVTLLVSPVGREIVLRFTNLRELGSMTVRIWYFRTAWERVRDHFLWGMGLSQGWTYPDRLYNTDPHNWWLALAYELGLPGVILWAAVLVLLWREIRKVAAYPGTRELGRGLQVSFWVSQLHTLVEPTFQGRQYQYVFFWLMGGAIGYARWARMRDRSAPSPLRPDPLRARASSPR